MLKSGNSSQEEAAAAILKTITSIAQVLFLAPVVRSDSMPGAGDGCLVWYTNSWALGWSRKT